MASRGIILGYQAEYFSSRTVSELLTLGFTEGQIPYLAEELDKLGLAFKEEAAIVIEEVATIEPLVEEESDPEED